MERRPVNPWTWQDALGYAQAFEVTGATRMLLCSGQISVDADGNMLHPGDMQAQVLQALTNLETVLSHAGYTPADIVHIRMYTTDVDALMAALAALGERFQSIKLYAAATVIGISRLASPKQMIEIEATAMA